MKTSKQAAEAQVQPEKVKTEDAEALRRRRAQIAAYI